MLFQVDDFDLPEWAHDELRAQCAERAIGVEELCEIPGLYPRQVIMRSQAGAQFTVPNEMEARLVGEGFMVLRRNLDGVVLTPCEPMAFEDALAEFQSNGVTEEDIVRAVIVALFSPVMCNDECSVVYNIVNKIEPTKVRSAFA